ncbi:hypothetical protein [Rhizobium wuzhouense]|uniref:hypothetical protein n=1 Tax=Rhizobium wuzhouense TaxID=1986026 RepID=UPI0010576F4F|nr:hypothetical protein [Rhizobium wuzhouense]
MNRYIGSGAIFIMIAALFGFFFWPVKPVIVLDHLCDFVRDQQKLECMAVLAADNFVAPGSFVEAVANEVTDKRVPLPRGNLFGDSCIIPGADGDAIKAELSKHSSISIPTFTYDVDRSLKEGVELQIPKLEALSLKAGPNFKSVSKVELSTEDAWAVNVDELSAHQALSSCSVKRSCVDYIKSQQYRVIGTALVAKGLSYKLYNSENQLLSLDAAVKSEAITASVGGSGGVTSTTKSTLTASEARVIGVRFLPVDFFSNQPVCERDVLYSASGVADVSIVGGGGRGNIGNLIRDQKPLGEVAAVQRTGSETSECRDGIDRKTSAASAYASVKQIKENTLELSYDLIASGGHYVTVAGCVAGQWIGKTGHDTTAVATSSIAASISALVRSESGARLTLEYDNVPESLRGRLTISVRDWRGQQLREEKKESVDFSDVVGSGSKSFLADGPGLYRFEVTANVDRTVGGNVEARDSATARFTLVTN